MLRPTKTTDGHTLLVDSTISNQARAVEAYELTASSILLSGCPKTQEQQRAIIRYLQSLGYHVREDALPPPDATAVRDRQSYVLTGAGQGSTVNAACIRIPLTSHQRFGISPTNERLPLLLTLMVDPTDECVQTIRTRAGADERQPRVSPYVVRIQPAADLHSTQQFVAEVQGLTAYSLALDQLTCLYMFCDHIREQLDDNQRVDNIFIEYRVHRLSSNLTVGRASIRCDGTRAAVQAFKLLLFRNKDDIPLHMGPYHIHLHARARMDPKVLPAHDYKMYRMDGIHRVTDSSTHSLSTIAQLLAMSGAQEGIHSLHWQSDPHGLTKEGLLDVASPETKLQLVLAVTSDVPIPEMVRTLQGALGNSLAHYQPHVALTQTDDKSQPLRTRVEEVGRRRTTRTSRPPRRMLGLARNQPVAQGAWNPDSSAISHRQAMEAAVSMMTAKFDKHELDISLLKDRVDTQSADQQKLARQQKKQGETLSRLTLMHDELMRAYREQMEDGQVSDTESDMMVVETNKSTKDHRDNKRLKNNGPS